MKSRLASLSSFVRMPLIAWNAPPAIISDMSGTTLLGLFGALAIGGTPPTLVLKPSGNLTLPDGEEGLTVSESERRAAAARFLAGLATTAPARASHAWSTTTTSPQRPVWTPFSSRAWDSTRSSWPHFSNRNRWRTRTEEESEDPVSLEPESLEGELSVDAAVSR